LHVLQLISIGCGVNDYDSVSGFTLLHFAARCGSKNVGNSEMAITCIQYLLEKNATVYIRDLWMAMMTIHYGAFYNVPAVINSLLSHNSPLGIDL